jgi:elongation factor P
MVSAGDFRNGLTIEFEGNVYQVIEFQHVKPGKGAAILKTKMKNLKTGSTQERNFNASTKFEAAMIEKKSAQYSYSAGDVYYFMDMETFETYELDDAHVGMNKYFLIEGMDVILQIFEGQVIAIVVPDKVELTVAETTPAIKGAPSSQTKDAVTDTGLSIRVPQFIEEGEKILVSTSDGKYSSRA